MATVALSLTGLAACTGGGLPEPDVAAEVAGRNLRYQEFELYLRENSVDDETALGAEILSKLFDRFLEEELIRELAQDQGLVPPGSSRRVSMEAALARVTAVEIPAHEVESYFRSHPGEFDRPETVDLRQVLLEDREVAEQVRAAWVAGVPFEELIERSETGAGVYQSSDTGLARTDLPPALAGTIFDLVPGEVSEIVTVDYGFHLFQVTARHPARRLDLAESTEIIRRRLGVGLADGQIGRMVGQARERYNVRVFARNLPFQYDGDF